MLSHREMIGLQAEKHELINAENFASEEECVLHLIHTAAYLQAGRLAGDKIVLDLGCNTGYGTDIMSGTARRVVGVDVSADAIDIAKSKYGAQGLAFHLIDGQRLPFDDGEFDMVASCQVIEHIVDHAQFINEIKRVLSPSGYVVFTTPNAAIRLDPGMKPWNPFHVREYHAAELAAALLPFFQHIDVLGLFASESIYRVEKARLDRARNAARQPSQQPPKPTDNAANDRLKALLPASALSLLKSMRDTLRPAPRAAPRHTYPQYAVEQLFYRREGIQNALDLLAVCSNDARSQAAALQRFNL